MRWSQPWATVDLGIISGESADTVNGLMSIPNLIAFYSCCRNSGKTGKRLLCKTRERIRKTKNNFTGEKNNFYCIDNCVVVSMSSGKR